MTAQINDVVLYRGREHDLAGISGTGFFDPAEHGLQPHGFSTACWRGFHCTYEVAEQSLFLTRLNIGLSLDDRAALEAGGGPRLFGRAPRRYTIRGHSVNVHTGETKTSWDSSDFLVDGFRELIPFTGGLLLGAGFISRMYVHMGFHPPYKYRVVHELIFESGRLVEECDRSEQMAELRRRAKPRSKSPASESSRAEISQWVAECFNRDYRRSGPKA
jgi:hypothetical protein